MEDENGSPWDALTADLVERIALHLPPNEVACNLKLLNKAVSRILQRWNLVRLTQPVPQHAYVQHWGGEESMQGLPLKQRKQLLVLLARSGNITNLEAATSVAGIPLTHEVFKAAATNGHVEAMAWLLDHDCAHNYRTLTQAAAGSGHAVAVRWILKQSPDPGALVRLAEIGLVAAAGAGHRSLCEELLAAGAHGVVVSLAAPSAARGGHLELTMWLLDQGPRFQNADVNDPSLLLEAAYGFTLPVLQRLYHARLGSDDEPFSTSAPDASASDAFAANAGFAVASPYGYITSASAGGRSSSSRDDFAAHWGERVALQALTGPTPDWAAKLEWLEAVGCRLNGGIGAAAAVTARQQRPRGVLGWAGVFDCTDALERVEYLWRRGLVEVGELLRVAVTRGSVTVLRFLAAEGLLMRRRRPTTERREEEEEGQQEEQEAYGAGRDVVGGCELTEAAAAAGDVDVLRELLAAGWPVGPAAARAAAAAGHLHVLRWMLLGEEQEDKDGRSGRPEAATVTPVTVEEDEEKERQRPAVAAAASVRAAMAADNDDGELLHCAAESGSLELVEWLWERGCRRWGGRTFAAAVGAGNCAMLQWLVARGCPMGAPGQAYLTAGRNGDLSTLRCLRRLGCPWGPPDGDGSTSTGGGVGGSIFLQALGGQGGVAPCSLAVLRWLVAQGCLVDWPAARARVVGRAARDRDAAAVRAWIEGEYEARRAVDRGA